MPTIRQLPVDDLDLEDSAPKRGRGPGRPFKAGQNSQPKPITLTALKEMIGTANAAFVFSGHPELILADAEIDELAHSWHDVIKMYPQFGRYLSQGNSLSVWGKALLTTLIIVERRRVVLSQHSPGAARPGSGHDRQRQDHLNGAGAVESAVRDRGGPEA